MKLLFVNACVREHSRTLLLARHLLSRLSAQVCEIRLEDLDLKPLTRCSLARRDDLLRQGKWEDPSLKLARQFADADCIVIAAPYWDLGFPALLKIYLETVTVSGITFCYEEGRPRGLCKARKLYYITTAGGPILSDFGYPYVRSLAENLYGIQETRCIRAENLDMDGVDVACILEETIESINKEDLNDVDNLPQRIVSKGVHGDSQGPAEASNVSLLLCGKQREAHQKEDHHEK